MALADDHVLLRNGLAGLVTKLGYTVLFECNNGKDGIFICQVALDSYNNSEVLYVRLI